MEKVLIANLKSEVDKLDINKLSELDADKLKPVPIDLKNLSDVVDKKAAKKDVYNAKIKDIEDKIPNITNLAALNAKINDVKHEIPNITNLARNNFLNAKINEVKCEIPSITNLATTAALTTVENKIRNVSDLVREANCDAEINDINPNKAGVFESSFLWRGVNLTTSPPPPSYFKKN